MKRFRRGRIAPPLVVGIVAALGAGGNAVGQIEAPGSPGDMRLPRYEVTEIGTFGGSDSCALDVNGAGQAVGYAQDAAGMSVAFLFEDGQLTNLGTLPGYDRSTAYAINEDGVIVGTAISATSTEFMAWVYRDGEMMPLGTLGGRWSGAMGISSSRIVGWALPPTDSRRFHAFLHESDTMQGLGTLPEASWSQATAVNDAGVVVGISQDRTGYVQAMQWSPDEGMQRLPNLGGQGLYSYAEAINRRGVVAGWAKIGERYIAVGGIERYATHAVVWREGVAQDLGTLGGATSQAKDIGERLDVVGRADDATGTSRAFLYRDDRMLDLNRFVVNDHRGVLATAEALGSRGHIAGAVKIRKRQRAFVLTPVR